MNGWIKTYRVIQEDPMYFAEPFTRIQAFLDLVLIANHKRTTFFKRGIKITAERGQVIRSEEELAQRWKWSRGKVRRFLVELENDTKIVQQKTRLCNCISIVNYNKYQPDDTTDSTTDDTTDSTTKYKNEKNNILSTSTTGARARDGTTDEEDPKAEVLQDGIDEDIRQLRTSAIWLGTILMNHKVQFYDLDDLFSKFAAECRCNGLERHQDLKDAKQHFNNWLRIYKQKQDGTSIKSGAKPTPNDNIEAAQREQLERTYAVIAASKK